MANVTIVSPQGNPEVWPENLAAQKLQQGYKAFDTWKAEQESIAQQKHQEWLTSPDTMEERFQMLRMARDGKLTEHDKHVAQLERNYRMGVDVTVELSAWDAYAQALCNITVQPGAPWDGGGNLTPWPVAPTV